MHVVKKDKDTPQDAVGLRRLAEARLGKKKSGAELPLTGDKAERTVHELEVHQIELEMQNEELKQAREGLEAQFEKYSDLYNFAPVGYFTLDEDGIIREANLTGAKLLGYDRSRLAGTPFSSFLTGESHRAFHEFLEKMRRGAGQETCELTLKGDRLRFIGIEGAAIEAGEEAPAMPRGGDRYHPAQAGGRGAQDLRNTLPPSI